MIGELLRAVVTRKPVIALLEVEAKHGGMARETIREKLLATDEPCERDGTMHTSWYQMWGLDAEVEQWGYVMPTCDELYAALFASQPIQWDRIPAFQDVKKRELSPRRVLPRTLLPGAAHTIGSPSGR